MNVESNVIGILFNYPEEILQISSILKPEHFENPKYKTIYGTMLDMVSQNEDVNLLTLKERLKGKLDTENLAKEVAKYEYMKPETAAYLVKDEWVLRELKKAGKRIESLKNKTEVKDVVADIENTIYKITNSTSNNIVTYNEVRNELLSHIEKVKASNNLFQIPTGFIDVDKILGGLRKGELTIIAARPSIGKTSFALNIADNVEDKVPVGIFSLEMGRLQLMARQLSRSIDAPVIDILNGFLSPSQAAELYRATKDELRIVIDDTSQLTTSEIRSRALLMKNKYNIGLIIVDYLQLIKGIGDTREQEISSISRGMKQIAKDLDIPVVVLSQLNRQVESRSNKRPQLSDLRESGAIEQDADSVIFLHRPEVYNILQFEDGESTENVAEVIIAKNRNGAIGDARLVFIKEKTLFRDKARIDF